MSTPPSKKDRIWPWTFFRLVISILALTSEDGWRIVWIVAALLTILADHALAYVNQRLIYHQREGLRLSEQIQNAQRAKDNRS